MTPINKATLYIETVMIRSKFYNTLLITLITVTCITIILQIFSLKKTLVLQPDTHKAVKAISDQSLNGTSSATLIKNNNKWLLKCNIQASSYNWPFCEIALNFFEAPYSKSMKGLDLSSYSSIQLKAKYLNHPNSSIRIQLRNYNDSYAKIDDDSTWKYIGIEYWPDDMGITEIPMKSLQVASWWLNEQKIPIHLSAPEFDSVMVIEISTGNKIKPGQYMLELEYIKFTGKFFTNSQVLYTLIALWVFSAIIVLLLNLKHSREKLTNTAREAQELKQLNQLLNVKTKTLKDKAERDPLTGALNRSGIQPYFTQKQKKLSLIFIDIDHFKLINDIHGHLVGDEILKEFVKTISENCRNTDIIARWGGEEFLLVCPDTLLSEAFELAQLLRKIMDEKTWVNNIKLTSSFGVAQRGDESASDFIERADKALYDAKARGRNQVVMSKPTSHLNPLI
ncbi:GGDEF domain-containing protein [Thalassotalea profundi]|uniref:diguanylate cyclase n=1 Tax=Thalassotalea profundi TaxID=2036687 RepID=A0ABQ3IUJ1_9GAMM|nr:GGDEF domain-containing protein [Thalassotalea profundi]GHE94977.1 GGDEF domain-containing protein [Thalassotalea profundi]